MRQSVMEKCRFRLHFAEPTRSLIEGVTEEEPYLDREEGGITRAIEPWVTSPSIRILTAHQSRRQIAAEERGSQPC